MYIFDELRDAGHGAYETRGACDEGEGGRDSARPERERERGGRLRSGEDETETKTESDRAHKYTNGRSERDRNV